MTSYAGPGTSSRLQHTTVGDAMHPGVVSCPPDADVASIARALSAHRIHCAVVAGIARRAGGEHLTWGIVSDLDLMRALQPGVEETDASRLAATDVMTIGPDESLERAAQLMAEHEVAHLVVVTARDALPVGVVSSLDVARVAAGA